MEDLLITNATIVDGSGSPAFKGSISVTDGKITGIGAPDCEAKEVIDAGGLTVSPGFIDAHCHEDATLGNPTSTLAKVSQGITTVCGGQCGSSWFPVSKDPEKLSIFLKANKAYLNDPECNVKETVQNFTSMAEYRKYIESRPIAYNATVLTGHNELRIAAMGLDNRKPTGEELEIMKALLKETMENGSRGLSAGLIYTPSCYSEKEELIELCKVIAPYDGTFSVHLRNEAGHFIEAINEAMDIARAAGCRLNLSHHKVCGRENWGKSEISLKMIEDAKKDGMDIYTDVYPYLATGSNLNICLPKEIFAYGAEKVKEMLIDPSARAELKEKVIANTEGRYRNCGGFENILICGAPYTKEAENLTVAEYAKKIGKDEFEAYFDVVAANGSSAQAAYFAMSEDDLSRILLNDNICICTDSYDVRSDNAVHPRSYGAFTHALGYFVREKNLMPLETMIMKMTSKPAGFMKIRNKGLIKEGFDADLVIFDPDTVDAKADFKNARALSTGIDRVIVAGKTVYKDNSLTGERPGKFIPWR